VSSRTSQIIHSSLLIMSGLPGRRGGRRGGYGHGGSRSAAPSSYSHPTGVAAPTAAAASIDMNQQPGGMGQLEYGIVGAVKDSFGFIKSAERDGDIFFHFSDVLDPTAPLPRRGSEVRFMLQIEPSTGRSRALQVEEVPAGSIHAQYEQILEEKVRGVVVKGMMGQPMTGGDRRARQMTRAESLAAGRPEAYGGQVKRMQSSGSDGTSIDPAGAEYEFSERDLADANVILESGDIVAFDIFVERRSGRMGATHITLIEPNPQERERGKIVSVRENFGFIAMEEKFDDDDDVDGMTQPSSRRLPDRSPHNFRDRDQQLFVHFSEFLDPSYVPHIGDEVSFRIGRSPTEGKACAQRVAALPRGSINTREVDKELSTGIVTKQITFEPVHEQAQQTPASSPNTDADGHAEESADATTDTNAASSPAPMASAESSPSGADAPTFSPNPLSRIDIAAASSSSSSSSNRKRALRLSPGIITYTDANGATLNLPFRPNDLQQSDRRQLAVVLKGDRVTFHRAVLHTRSGDKCRATQVSVAPGGETCENRERGVVVSVREGFAFVESVDRRDHLFLHPSQLRTTVSGVDENPRDRRDPLMRVGMEVEFNAAEAVQPGKLAAVRVVVLPTGSVQFEEELPYTFIGTVTKGMAVRETQQTAAQQGSVDGSDSSSGAFSENDIRREQSQQATVRESSGDKGEIKQLSLAANSPVQPPSDWQMPDSAHFFDVDTIPPASPDLDRHSFVAGDSVTFRLRQHKRSMRCTAFNVQLQAMNQTGREDGQVIRVNTKDGTGQLICATRMQPIVFALRDAPTNGTGEDVQVGDCFSFNVAEPSQLNKRERQQHYPTRDESDGKPHAVRLVQLPRGSVVIESVDRSCRLRGYIAAMPERATKGYGKAAGRPGQLIAVQHLTADNQRDANLTHPASWLQSSTSALPPAAWEGASNLHAAALQPPLRALSGDSKYSFSLKDVQCIKSFLSKGDLLDFYLSVRTKPQVKKRAVEFSLVPLIGIVERIDTEKESKDANDDNQKDGMKSYTGLISVFNPHAFHTEETFLFHSNDVIQPQSASASSRPSHTETESTSASASPSPSPSASEASSLSVASASGSRHSAAIQLGIGDIVQFSDMILNQDKKKRQAKQIVRVKERTKGTEVRPGTKRKAGAPIISANRFARGPDAEGIGFNTPRPAAMAARAMEATTPNKQQADQQTKVDEAEAEPQHAAAVSSTSSSQPTAQ